MRAMVGTSVVEIVQGEIANQNTQAIVNVANNSLLGSKGLDGAIYRAAGQQVQEECKTLGGCDFGEARVTSGGNLRAKHIIHTAGPVYRGGKHGEAETLARAYRKCLELAVNLGVRRIAFPGISIGAGGYPPDEAAEVALRTIFEFLPTHQELFLVRLVLNSKDAVVSFELAMKRLTAKSWKTSAI